ncbi:MAG: tRNA pseudouridine(55) synthase TruB [Prochlorotrichaceae cyanobacterium]|jgi:tRNA pseudouridine55 synthase
MLGFLNFYKPTGCTSHDCVAQVRRALRTKRVGHGGTLDPAASGVLPIAVGQATRLLAYLAEGKAYQATIRFGLKTTTDDLEGEVLETADVEGLSLETIESLLPQFLGRICQTPPRYSAIQVQGKRLYDLARAGEVVQVPERWVQISSLKVLHWRNTPYPELDLAVECGAGTYIRSLARDLGDRLGTGATLAALIRTQSSGFQLEDSITIEQIQTDLEPGLLTLLSPTTVLSHLSTVRLDQSQDLQRWYQGQRLETATLATEVLSVGEAVLVVNGQEQCLGLGVLVVPEDNPLLQPKVVFNP